MYWNGVHLYQTSENANQSVSCLNGRFGVTCSVLLSYMALKVYPKPFFWLDMKVQFLCV